MSQRAGFDPGIELRPRGLLETFDLALVYLQAHLRDFLGPVAIVVVGALASVFVVALALALLEEPDASELASAFLRALEGGSSGLTLMLSVGGLERAITLFAGRHLFGTPISARQALFHVLGRALPIAVALAIATLPFLVLFADGAETDSLVGLVSMAIVGWPLVVAPFSYATEVVLLEQLSLPRALARSRVLTGRRMGRALGLVILGAGVRLLFAVGTWAGMVFVFGALFQIEGFAGHFGLASAMLGYVLSGPYMALVRFFDYIDARTRSEGWDIQVRFNAIQQREAHARAGRRAA